MSTLRRGDENYTITVGSDSPRDGFYAELCREADSSNIFVAEAFWSDTTGDFIVTVAESTVPFSVLEEFISESRTRVPPSSSPVEKNLFRKDSSPEGNCPIFVTDQT